jgi:formylglycine-generating enzyme required for sulfatase activity
MLYQMLTGELPRGAWRLPSKTAPVDSRWDAVVTQAMQQKPQDRYETATELKEDVNRIGPWAPPSRKMKLALGSGAVVVLIAMAGAAFLKKKEPPEPPLPPVAGDDGLPRTEPNGDLVFAGHRYRYVRGMHTWEFARAQAERLGGHLATITSRAEDDTLHELMEEQLTAQYQSCWIGASRPDDRTPWQWVTGEPFDYHNWTAASGEPTAFPAFALLWRPSKGGRLNWLRWQTNDFDKHGSDAWRGYLVEWESTSLPERSRRPSHVNASKAAPFVNSLGMKFVPVTQTGSGNAVLFSIWETRRRDFRAFASAVPTANREWESVPGVPSEPEHPVVMVNWEDAASFCAWLTENERAAGAIGPGDIYRLPSDSEWSRAAGISDESGDSPRVRGRAVGDYPWGRAWPPPPGWGNFLDASSKEHFEKTRDPALNQLAAGVPIEDYRDGFPLTAPVGSFPPNAFGIYDLAGNACEWCEDLFGPGPNSSMSRTLRGGGWNEGKNIFEGLRLGFRYEGSPRRSPTRGFRVVLETVR